MKKPNLIFLITAAIVMMACDTKDVVIPEEPLPARDKVPLQLFSGINMDTPMAKSRAHDTSWDANDMIGVFTTVAGSGTDSEHPYIITKSGSQDDANITYKITNSQETWVYDTSKNTYKNSYKAFAPSDDDVQIYLPADGSNVDVYAYYPRTEGVTVSAPLPITIPGGETTAQTLAEQKTVDVMKAKVLTDLTDPNNPKPINIDNTTAQLLFSHVLSKVIVKIKAGTGYSDSDLEGEKVGSVQLLGQPKQATFNPISQELAIPENPTTGTITMLELGLSANSTTNDPDYVAYDETNRILHTYRAIILPNGENNPVTTGTQRQIRFNVGQTYYLFDVTQQFDPGQETIFTITLAATGITVEAAISDWTSQAITPATPLYPEN